jgi:hypothetical protein
VYCVEVDDHDGYHLLDIVTHLPDGSAEQFLLTAAGAAAAIVRDRWALVVGLAGELHADGRRSVGSGDDSTRLTA